MKIIREKFQNILTTRNQILWLALAFHAGFLNAGGFLSCHRFVSHMTGFGTQFGVSIGINEFLVALQFLLAPIAFIVGACVAAYLLDRRGVNRFESSLLAGLLSIIILNAIVFLGGYSGFFGVFGEPLLLQRDFLLLYILVFICGLQNGLFSSITSNQVRTTHITGLTTDIGLSLVRIFFEPAGEKKEIKKKTNRLRMKMFTAFSFGSLVGANVFLKVGFWGFLVSTLISLGILAWVLFLVRVDPRQVGSEQGI